MRRMETLGFRTANPPERTQRLITSASRDKDALDREELQSPLMSCTPVSQSSSPSAYASLGRDVTWRRGQT